MKVLELHSKLRKYGISVRGHYLIEGGYKVGKIETARGGQIEEISGLPPELDNQISGIILGMK